MPNTVNKALNTPNTGDLPGAWGTAAVNNNMTVIDGLLGGVQTISLTNANVSLTISTGVIGTGSITPGAGPVQSDNAVIKFAGTLSGNCDVTFPAPGYWIVENNCTVGAFYVRARAAGTGNLIGIPPGEPCHIYNDGVDAKFVNMGRVGTFMDLCVATTPAWISACTVLPYLPCVGTATYSASVYPALFAMLGSTFGGNGINNFAVPDLGNRVRVPLDSSGAGRITFAGSGMTGTLLGAVGGAQNQSTVIAHTHGVTDSGHAHAFPYGSTGGGGNGIVPANTIASPNQGAQNTQSATTSVSIQTTGSATTMAIVQPSLIFGISFIKT